MAAQFVFGALHGEESGWKIPASAGETARLAEIVAAGNQGGYSPAPAIEISVRGGLPRVFEKFVRGESATIAYFGTSVTNAPGWRSMTFAWLQQRFPQAKLTMVNASLGGTGSLVGAFRADDDLLPCKPDLVFVEFAGNDNGDALTQPMDVLRAMEGIVRKIRRSDPATAICFVYTPGPGDFKLLRAGQLSRGATLHELIAEHYGVPSILVSLDAARLEEEGKLVIRAPSTADGLTPDGKIIYTEDGSHPTEPRGYGLWAAVVERGLERLRTLNTPPPPVLPPPLLNDHWADAKTIALDGHARLAGGWEKLTDLTGPAISHKGKSVYETVPSMFRTTRAGASLTVRFKGTAIGIKGIIGPDSGWVSIQIDDAPPTRICQFNAYGKQFSYGGRSLPALHEGVHTVTWTLLEEKPDKRAILAAYARPGNEQDLIDHPGKYAPLTFSAAEILLVGEILPPNP